MKLRVAHIVPSMNIGGVEVAIDRTIKKLRNEFDYQVYCVKSLGQIQVGQKTIFCFLCSIFTSSSRPDVVLTSLWWSHPFGLLAYFFGIKWIVFLHSSNFASFPDRIITKIALRYSNNFFYDSEKTKSSMLKSPNLRQFHIPYLTIDVDSITPLIKNTEFDLTWVGRNSPEKRPDLAAIIIERLLKIRPITQVSVSVVGSNYEPFDKLALSFPKNMKLYYNASPKEVISRFGESKITLCVSDYEGFSMSTAEAAIVGNLIAARQVGDLIKYLPLDETIWLHEVDESSLNRFVCKLSAILDSNEAILHQRKVTKQKMAKFLKNKSYTRSFVNGINAVAEEENTNAS